MNFSQSPRARPDRFGIGVTSLCLLLTLGRSRGEESTSQSEAAGPHDSEPAALFAPENLVAWCIVPFDAKKRGPKERAEMLTRLGLKKLAYDWRAEHVPTFGAELDALREHEIELVAFWDAHEDMFRLWEERGLHPQVWKTAPSPEGATREARIEASARELLPLVERTRKLGSKLGLYNHGGWGGEPENLIAVCEWLRKHADAGHVGIVYNLHHGHEHIDDFAAALAKMEPYLLCLNLNGMNDGAQPKILAIGSGARDREIVGAILRSGYRGPIGILDHREDTDAETSLRENLDGLRRLVATLDAGKKETKREKSSESGTALAPLWPRFRGPDATGVSNEEGLPTSWSTTENVTWSVPIAGRSWSSPIIAGDRIFLTTAISEGEDYDAKKGLYFGGNRPEPLPDVHHFEVLALAADTGEVVWEEVAHAAKPETPIHIKNTYASETPATDGERVFALFGNIGLFAYSVDGEKLWEKRWDPLPMRFGWGTASSPVVHEDRVFVVHDNDKASWLAAFDAKTGDELFRVDRSDEKSNWSTPFVWENAERTELVTAGTVAVRSYDLGGKLLWSLEGMSSITIGAPYASQGLLYVSSGYVGDRNRPIYAIRPGATGDISLAGDKRSNEAIAWSLPDAAPYNPTTIVYGDYLYTLLDRGFFVCYDARTGEMVYDKQRLGVGTNFTSSPWAYDGKIFCLSEDGETYVIRAGKDFEILRTNPLEEMCMASPAISRGSLFIRTMSKLYRISEKGTGNVK